MSTKTIAVESSVYARLAKEKRESESFTKVISRVLDAAEQAHTGVDILSHLSELRPLGADDAERMLAVVKEGRDEESWERHDLR
jgi:predicted CopG family antitoxin